MNSIREKLQNSANKGSAKNRFVERIYETLQAAEFSELIAWSSDGDNILIKDVKEFAETVLPQLFSHQNFSSFVRQLNLYDFKKSRDLNLSCCYSNPNFKKDRSDLLIHIKRKSYKPVQNTETLVNEEREIETGTENEVLILSEKRLRDQLAHAQKVINQLQVQNQQLRTQILETNDPVINEQRFSAPLRQQIDTEVFEYRYRIHAQRMAHPNYTRNSTSHYDHHFRAAQPMTHPASNIRQYTYTEEPYNYQPSNSENKCGTPLANDYSTKSPFDDEVLSDAYFNPIHSSKNTPADSYPDVGQYLLQNSWLDESY
jgi:hypothetical protein